MHTRIYSRSIRVYIGSRINPGSGRSPSSVRTSVFTRYWKYQYCMVYVIRKGGRAGVVYCAILVQ